MKLEKSVLVKHREQIFFGLMIWAGVSLVMIVLLAWYVFDVVSSPGTDNATAGLAGPSSPLAVVDKDNAAISGYQLEIIDIDGSGVGEVVERVAKHILLPRGQVTVATIEDIESLRRDFPGAYQYAKNKDKVLFYPNGVIIYDVEADRIVDVIRFLPQQ